MIRIYDTQARKKRDFVPIVEGEVSMYVCGPTIYNKVHIGNARTFISFDIIRRYLIWRGYKVTFVQNLTDCDDKIINKANEEGRSPQEVTDEFSKKFIDDMHNANVLDPDIRPRATQEIPEMIELIETLIEKGFAYVEDGDVYFDVSKDKTYGTLSGRDLDQAQSGHRELIADGSGVEKRKHDEEDFALWKSSKPGEPSWESPWGLGRPGWHTECVCMSKKYLGVPFDIHGGGADLIFPHHENEIAQATCAWDSGFANYWMHGGMLNVDGEKMSKSLGNFMLLDEVLSSTSANALRTLNLQTHYRSPLNFSKDRLLEAEKALSNIKNCSDNLTWLIKNASSGVDPIDDSCVKSNIDELKENFIANMDDDFNAPAAFGEINSFIGKINRIYDPKITINDENARVANLALAAIIELMDVFGIKLEENEKDANEIPEEIKAVCAEVNVEVQETLPMTLDLIIEKRADARKNKDWEVADQIRDLINDAGWTIEDTAQGTKISKKS